MRGQLLLADFALIGPELAGVCGHAHKHLRVVGNTLGRQMLPLERLGENVFHAHGDISQQRAERPRGIGFRRIAGQYTESVGVLLNISKQRHGRTLHNLTRVCLGVGQRVDEHVGERTHLTVHHHGVQPFFAAEMLVHDRFRDFGGRGDLLDAYRFESLCCEQGSADLDKLFAPLKRRHPGCVGHNGQFFTSYGCVGLLRSFCVKRFARFGSFDFAGAPVGVRCAF